MCVEIVSVVDFVVSSAYKVSSCEQLIAFCILTYCLKLEESKFGVDSGHSKQKCEYSVF